MFSKLSEYILIPTGVNLNFFFSILCVPYKFNQFEISLTKDL